MDQTTEPTRNEMALAAAIEQKAEVTGSLARILGVLDIDADEDGWEDDAVELIENLLAVAESAQKFMYSTPKSGESAAIAELDQALRALEPEVI